MFTGIIEETGKIIQINNNSITIECEQVLNDAKTGDSIAVNGVCLTVTNINKNFFKADVSEETFSVTSFKKIKNGDVVNLERALMLNERLGGHIVSGHVDGIAKCENISKNGNFYNIEFSYPENLSKQIVKKGSVTINGISLTVAKINEKVLQLAIIPHTFENTNLKYLKNGDIVNIETDILAKYVEKFLSTSDNKSRINPTFLQENGFY